MLDACSRRMARHAMVTHLRTALVLDVLNITLHQRRPSHVMHHSDHGCPYTALAFGHRCGTTGARRSRGTVDDRYDNTMLASFAAPL